MCETETPSLSLFQRLIHKTRPESSKRAISIWATWTLALAVIGIGGCIAYRIKVAGDVGVGAVGAFTAVTVPLAGLAGFNYRKPEAEEK